MEEKKARCPNCGYPIINLFARKGGLVKSKAKAEAARKNGKLGGRPKKTR